MFSRCPTAARCGGKGLAPLMAGACCGTAIAGGSPLWIGLPHRRWWCTRGHISRIRTALAKKATAQLLCRLEYDELLQIKYPKSAQNRSTSVHPNL